MPLPFESKQHTYTPVDGKGVIIETANQVVIFSKEIKESNAEMKSDILIAQRFFDPRNRYVVSEDDPTVKFERDITEYVINKIYGNNFFIIKK